MKLRIIQDFQKVLEQNPKMDTTPILELINGNLQSTQNRVMYYKFFLVGLLGVYFFLHFGILAFKDIPFSDQGLTLSTGFLGAFSCEAALKKGYTSEIYLFYQVIPILITYVYVSFIISLIRRSMMRNLFRTYIRTRFKPFAEKKFEMFLLPMSMGQAVKIISAKEEKKPEEEIQEEPSNLTRILRITLIYFERSLQLLLVSFSLVMLVISAARMASLCGRWWLLIIAALIFGACVFFILYSFRLSYVYNRDKK